MSEWSHRHDHLLYVMTRCNRIDASGNRIVNMWLWMAIRFIKYSFYRRHIYEKKKKFKAEPSKWMKHEIMKCWCNLQLIQFWMCICVLIITIIVGQWASKQTNRDGWCTMKANSIGELIEESRNTNNNSILTKSGKEWKIQMQQRENKATTIKWN